MHGGGGKIEGFSSSITMHGDNGGGKIEQIYSHTSLRGGGR